MGISNPLELDSLNEAVRIAGSQSELARQIGVAQASVWKMLHKAHRASAEFVLKIEAATGVSRHDLRPDLYPREDAPAPQAVLPIAEAAS
jgi:DNA-binding transcriptional regulator YdaS (Cro superfamily)